MSHDDEFSECTFNSPPPLPSKKESNVDFDFRPTDDIAIDDICSLKSWLEIITKQGGVCLEDVDITLNFFGEDDDTYLLIHRYTGKNKADVYFFKTEDRRNPLNSLIQWLGCINYSLHELLELLDNSHYQYTEMGDEIRYFGMIITKTQQEHRE
ncbi:hypothetical protein [Aliikangiella sp. IMCC44359]|uniref:hypothetical protein n=1 Tax=Aliikangiella sp. IMCC44359 TaxID=3459125 RepID=UPI00403B14B0